MQISIIIRTLNEESNIAKCLDALVEQTLKPKEILIIDNMSSDNTVEIASTFKARLPIRIIDNPIIGFSSGLELGVKEAKFPYVAFISSDCFADANWLELLSKYLKEFKCGACQGIERHRPMNDIHYVLENERSIIKDPQKIKFFNNTNTLYDLATLKKFLPFKGVGDYLYGEDTLMSFDFAASGVAVYLVPAYVDHNMFPDQNEFTDRIYKHAKSSLNMFIAKPFSPRIYLNAYYWVFIETIKGITKHDKRFLLIAKLRLIYTMKGMADGIVDIAKSNK